MAPSRILSDDSNAITSATNSSVDKSKLRILACASPGDGHTYPIIKIAEQLIQRGYDITFIAGEQFQKRVEEIGAKFVVVPPYDGIPAIVKLVMACETPMEKLGVAMEKLFIEPTGTQMKIVYAALENMKKQSPDDNIIILTETFFPGDIPLYFGAPPPKGFAKRPRIININACCYSLQSRDTAPFGMGIVPDGSPESRERFAQLHEEAMKGPLVKTIKLQQKTITDLGGSEIPRAYPFDTMTIAADIVLQMCPPSIEYKRSDLHPRVRFAGAIAAAPFKQQNFVAPHFWDHVTRGEKKVVVVTQGTVAINYNNLLIPTLKALAPRSDLIVVAILGQRNASLPAEIIVPPNAFVIDHLAYDAILPHASVFICNGGYGGFIHGVVNGVPMIIAGASEDKPEVAGRGEVAGIAINLKTEAPSETQISEAVETILVDDCYSQRVKEIKLENEKLNAIGAVEKAILEAAAWD